MIHLLDFSHILWLQTKDLYPLCVSKFFVCLLQTLTHLHHHCHKPRSNCQAITSPLQEDDGISLDWRSLAVTYLKPCNLPMLFHWRHFGSHFPWSHTDTHTLPSYVSGHVSRDQSFVFLRDLDQRIPGCQLPNCHLPPFFFSFAPAALNHHFPDCQFPH